jgi:hypothetical protein
MALDNVKELTRAEFMLTSIRRAAGIFSPLLARALFGFVQSHPTLLHCFS